MKLIIMQIPFLRSKLPHFHRIPESRELFPGLLLKPFLIRSCLFSGLAYEHRGSWDTDKFKQAMSLPHTQEEESLDTMVLAVLLSMGLSMTGILTLLYIKTLREKRISQVKKTRVENI